MTALARRGKLLYDYMMRRDRHPDESQAEALESVCAGLDPSEVEMDLDLADELVALKKHSRTTLRRHGH